MQVRKRCFVSGHVQGVFYRASTGERARALGLTGYARNLSDGRVEVLVCGEATAVQQLVDWLWQGPPAAKVENVEVSDTDEAAPPDFATRR